MRPFRHARLEPLEPRWVLSSAPILAPIADVTLLAGAPLHIALDGFDADGDTLSFSITSTNDDLVTTVPSGNRSMKIVVPGYGDMVFELFEDLAPRTTARIIELAESGFYDGLIFHRIASYTDGTPFVIQGGDPLGTGTGGSGVDFDDEFHPDLLHTSSGILSMAKGQDDDSNDSQFFITGTATRHLDFNHSIFGFLVEGDDVRQAIQDVDVNSASKPLVDVVMDSVDVFYDTENGTLRLSAAEGTTGEGFVTVTVSDGNGGTATQTFHVNIVADSVDNDPFLSDIPDVVMTGGTTKSITLPAIDVEGDAIYYGGGVYPASNDLMMSVHPVTGVATITAKSTAAGVYGLFVGVYGPNSSSYDTQYVPVLINPAAPTSIELLATSDSGEADGVTNFNNSDGQPLWFRVDGVIDGAEVSLFADGELIGQATADGDSVLIVVSSSTVLADGVHSITASQKLNDVELKVGNRDETVDLASEVSAALSITVDTNVPTISSTPIVNARMGVLYQYNVESPSEGETGVAYRLVTAPTGMTIDPATGEIAWTPGVVHGTEQSVVVAIADTAGNETQQPFTLYINQAPAIWPIANHTVEELSLLTFDVVATDAEDDLPITFALADDAPAGAAIDPDTGVFTWTPTEEQGPGVYSVTVLASDSNGSTNQQTITITVTEKNEPPVLNPIDDATLDEGQLLDIDVTTTDPDLPAQQLSYGLAPGAPAGAAIDLTTGRFTWRPGESHGGGTFTITVVVSDPFGATDEQTFHVTVNEVDDPPVFVARPTQYVAPGMPLRLAAVAIDPDVPTNSIRYNLESDAPVGATIDPDTGVVTWDIPADYPMGLVDLVVRATEVLSDGTLGLETIGTLQVFVVHFPTATLDAAFARGDDDEGLTSPVVELAKTLWFDEAAPVAAMQSARVTTTDSFNDASSTLVERPLGFQIASDTGGNQILPIDVQEHEEDGGVTNPIDTQQQPTPRENSERSTAPSQPGRRRDVAPPPLKDETYQRPQQADAVPPEVLDAAMEQLAEEEHVPPDEAQLAMVEAE